MENDIYDIVVDIKTFEDLKNNGWEIKMNEKGNEKYNYFSNIDLEKKELKRIGILGGGGVGKTFILHKLLNKEYNKKIKTKGISVIYPEIDNKNNIVYLDTCNTFNTSLYNKNKKSEELYNLNDSKTTNYINELNKEKTIKNIFIEDFIIEKSNIIVIVINDLTFKEQKILNRLKNQKNFSIMLIIHNLKFFCDIKSIEEYIENILKQSVFSNLEKRFIINLNDIDKKDDEKTYYYIEKEFGSINNFNENSVQKIIHLFMGKEGSEAGDYFNNQTIEYIRHFILTETRTRIFDIIKEIKEFLSFNSKLYMIKEDNKERPIEENEIEIADNDEGIYLKCKNKNFKLKDCITNEMGITNFIIDNSINPPPFICYKGIYENKRKNEKWPALIVKAEMFVNANDIKISQNISDDNETMNIIISCEKKFEKDLNIVEEEEIIEGDDIKKNMRIHIKINLNNIIFDDNKPPRVKEPFPGIKLIYFEIIEKINDDIKGIIIKKKKK